MIHETRGGTGGEQVSGEFAAWVVGNGVCSKQAGAHAARWRMPWLGALVPLTAQQPDDSDHHIIAADVGIRESTHGRVLPGLGPQGAQVFLHVSMPQRDRWKAKTVWQSTAADQCADAPGADMARRAARSSWAGAGTWKRPLTRVSQEASTIDSLSVQARSLGGCAPLQGAESWGRRVCWQNTCSARLVADTGAQQGLAQLPGNIPAPATGRAAGLCGCSSCSCGRQPFLLGKSWAPTRYLKPDEHLAVRPYLCKPEGDNPVQVGQLCRGTSIPECELECVHSGEVALLRGKGSAHTVSHRLQAGSVRCCSPQDGL